MDFDFSFEQRTLAESVSRVLKALPPVADVPPHAYAPDEAISALAGLGLFGEGDEGSPLGHVDAVAVALEAGRAVVAAPVIEAIAGSMALAPIHPELARSIAGGRTPGIAVSGGIAAGTGKDEAAIVPHGRAAALFAIPSGQGHTRDWTVLPADMLRLETIETTDITACAVRARLADDAAPSRANGAPAVDMDDLLRLLALAEITGAAAAMLERTVGYVGERKQFGKPIGSNQAVKHMAADCAVAIETMKAAVEYAGWALDQSAGDADAAGGEARLALESAASYVGEHGRRVAERCVQMHGGIAFTWDYGLHIPLRRILFRTATIARPRDAREALAATLLD